MKRCKTHPTYRAIGKPRANCLQCWRIWHRKQLRKGKAIFECGTGPLGTTDPGQAVTLANIHKLAPGSVVRNPDFSRIIHLHGDTWLYCTDGAWCYSDVEDMKKRFLQEGATACHVAPGSE